MGGFHLLPMLGENMHKNIEFRSHVYADRFILNHTTQSPNSHAARELARYFREFVDEVSSQPTHPADAENVQCPVCGYYCLGKGGHGCIDKPGMLCKTCQDFQSTEQTGRCPSCGQPALR